MGLFLIFDNLQELEPLAPTFAFLEALILEGPPGLALGLASRERLLFSLARLVASREACMLGNAELALDAAELLDLGARRLARGGLLLAF